MSTVSGFSLCLSFFFFFFNLGDIPIKQCVPHRLVVAAQHVMYTHCV